MRCAFNKTLTTCANRSCDKTFEQPKFGPRKEFCSRRCGHVERRARARDARPSELECAMCGNTYKAVYPDSGPASRYCSDGCKLDAKKARQRERYRARNAA